jgi:hypothetical protein
MSERKTPGKRAAEDRQLTALSNQGFGGRKILGFRSPCSFNFRFARDPGAIRKGDKADHIPVSGLLVSSEFRFVICYVHSQRFKKRDQRFALFLR